MEIQLSGPLRAAADGISAIVSAKGKVLTKRDHYTDGPGVIIADVRTYNKDTTPFAAGGYWLVGVCFIFVGYTAIKRSRRKQSPSPEKTVTDNNYPADSDASCG